MRLQLIVAVIYIVSGLIGQVFAIPPGNITPIWLPSGIMFALALHFGARIWLGIFLGAFFGNIWAYFSVQNWSIALSSILAATANGIGDVLAIVGMVIVLRSLIAMTSPFTSLKSFSLFLVLGCFVGGAISAMFGVSGLLLFGFIPKQDYVVSVINWWVGDGVGVLLLAPVVYSFMSKHENYSHYFLIGMMVSVPVFAVMTAQFFDFISITSFAYKLLALLTPLAFAIMLFSGQRAVYLVQILVVSIAVYATYQGKGPFIEYEQVSPLVALQVFIAIFSMIVFSIAMLIEDKRLMLIELNEKKAELESLYRHDQLTGLWNRYRIEEYLKIDIERLKRAKSLFSVFMIDIDDFKRVNDEHGHLEGDRVLKELSEILTQNTRSADLLGRWGGEEFIVIAVESELANAEEFASKLVKVIEGHDFGLQKNITVSVGYAVSKPNDSSQSIIERADKALYVAKSKGKNRAEFGE